MKKILFLAMLLMSSFAFSYGYRNTYWGETIDEFTKDTSRSPYEKKYSNYSYITEFTRLLGESTTLQYVFNEKSRSLIGICYTVEDNEGTRSKIEELIQSKRIKLKKRYKLNLSEEFLEEFNESIVADSCLLWLDDIIGYNKGYESLIEDFSKSPKSEKSDYEIIVADYDSTTEVHIIKGIIKDEITVVYTEKPQDF